MDVFDTGKQATRSQQLVFVQLLLTKRSEMERITIHHVTDTVHKLQLEVERACPVHGMKFERIIL